MEAGYFGLFAKYGQPPGWRYGEWDFRPEWDYFSERNKDIEVKFDASQPAWQLGVCQPHLRYCQVIHRWSLYVSESLKDPLSMLLLLITPIM